MRVLKMVGTTFAGGIAIAGVLATIVAADTPKSIDIAANLGGFDLLTPTLVNTKPPTIATPTWLKQQVAAAQQASQRAVNPVKTVTYTVATRGTITADINEFKSDANETLNSPKGWAAMGVQFTEVASGGMFTLYLAEASQLPLFSSGCSELYSCNAGNNVIINQDRWLYATTPWNQAGGSLRNYRNMVINHEVGHWLGHGHKSCEAAGQPAPVMQQQSIDLQGCTFNPWPLPDELWSTRLGITL